MRGAEDARGIGEPLRLEHARITRDLAAVLERGLTAESDALREERAVLRAELFDVTATELAPESDGEVNARTVALVRSLRAGSRAGARAGAAR